jgi:hypothetical protein
MNRVYTTLFLDGYLNMSSFIENHQMQKVSAELHSILEDLLPILQHADVAVYEKRPAPGKWSPKEIIGHLIDSAQTNIRRFIVARYEPEPTIVYQQDFWVTAAAYQERPLQELVQLWVLLNKQLVAIWNNIPEKDWQLRCVTGEPHTLAWLAEDYNRHLQHHLNALPAAS